MVGFALMVLFPFSGAPPRAAAKEEVQEKPVAEYEKGLGSR